MCLAPVALSHKDTATAGYLSRVWPVPCAFLLVLLPLLPTSCYLNRGYTLWYHWVAICYAMTLSPFFRSLAMVQGTGISLGWYMAIVLDYIKHGCVCHTLYKNTPLFLRRLMVEDTSSMDGYNPATGDIRTGFVCHTAMFLTHVVDIVAHPGIVYIMWRLHCREVCTLNSMYSGKHVQLNRVLTMPVILSSYALSRIWSLVHTYHNQGKAKLFYVGYDVYNLDRLDGWWPAYYTEAVLHSVALAWCVYIRQRR